MLNRRSFLKSLAAGVVGLVAPVPVTLGRLTPRDIKTIRFAALYGMGNEKLSDIMCRCADPVEAREDGTFFSYDPVDVHGR